MAAQTVQVVLLRLLIVGLCVRSHGRVWIAVVTHAACNLAWVCGPEGGALYDPRLAVVLLLPLVGIVWGRRRVKLGAGGVALLIGAGVLLIPGRFLPTPTGSFAIGTHTFEVVDEGRPEIFTERPDDVRRLPSQVWYPAASSTGARAPYVSDAQAFDAVAGHARVPSWALSWVAGIPTHARVDAPAAEGRFPVVVFVSGNMGYRQSNLLQVEELVSRGFVVVAFDQPGTSGTALLADGVRIPYAGQAVVRPLVDRSIDPARPVPLLGGAAYPQGLASYLAADAAAVLDHLEGDQGPLARHLDLEKVGAFGMSLGGYTVAQWCATDARVKACHIMDAPLPRDPASRGFEMPTLWLSRPSSAMRAEGWSLQEVEWYTTAQRAAFEATRAPAWFVEVPGINHADLTDAPLGSPLLAMAGLTSPHYQRAHEVMIPTTAAFFEHVLGGAPADPGEVAARQGALVSRR